VKGKGDGELPLPWGREDKEGVPKRESRSGRGG